jgi:hypothetical protein
MNTPNQASEEHVNELMLRYMDGDLTRGELSDLEHALRSTPGLIAEFAALLLVQWHLRQIGQERREAAAAARDSSAEGGHSWGALRLALRLWQLGRRRAGALGLGLGTAAVCLCFVLWHRPAPIQARLTRLEGRGTIERAGRNSPAVVGFQLTAGDRLRLDPNASATMQCQGQATEWALWDAADLSLQTPAQSRSLFLRSGSISAKVGQAGKQSPIRFSTPHAEAATAQADFTLSAGPVRTRVQVWTGKVRLTSAEGESGTEVPGGQLAWAESGRPLALALMRTGLLRELWPDVGPGGAAVSGSSRTGDAATFSEYLADFQTTARLETGTVARIRGFLRPPQSGFYGFWVAADAGAELWLSTDETPAHKAKICWTTTPTESREWDKDGSQQSLPVFLQAGRTYYTEAVQHGRGGTNGLAVAWLIPGAQRQVVASPYLVSPSGAAPAPRRPVKSP